MPCTSCKKTTRALPPSPRCYIPPTIDNTARAMPRCSLLLHVYWVPKIAQRSLSEKVDRHCTSRLKKKKTKTPNKSFTISETSLKVKLKAKLRRRPKSTPKQQNKTKSHTFVYVCATKSSRTSCRLFSIKYLLPQFAPQNNRPARVRTYDIAITTPAHPPRYSRPVLFAVTHCVLSVLLSCLFLCLNDQSTVALHQRSTRRSIVVTAGQTSLRPVACYTTHQRTTNNAEVASVCYLLSDTIFFCSSTAATTIDCKNVCV